MSNYLEDNNISPSTFVAMFEGTAFYDMLKEAMPEDEWLKLTGGIYDSKGNLRVNKSPAVQKALQTVLSDEIVKNLKEEAEAEAEAVASEEQTANIAAIAAQVVEAATKKPAASKAKAKRAS